VTATEVVATLGWNTRVEAVAQVAAVDAAANDAAAAFPLTALREMRTSGLLGCLVPAQFGGEGLTVREMAAAAYRLGRVDTSTAMVFAMHCQQSAAIVEHASPRLRRELLPRLAAGELYLASVTTEQRTGGHLLTGSTAAEQSGDRLHIDRFAPVCTGGAVADGFLVSMLSPTATSDTQTTLVYAARDQLVVEPMGAWNPVGMRATSSGPLRLSGSVPLWQVVGADGGFRDIAVNTFAPVGHIGWAACWLGCADGALSGVVKHLRKRGSALGELDRHRLSRLRLRSDSVHCMLRTAVDLYLGGPDVHATVPGRLVVDGLKVFCSEQALAMVEELMDLIGMRLGYMADSPIGLERAWRDLRSASLNYSNDRLAQADGALALLDAEVTHV